MGSYSHYRSQSAGRICHALEVYCEPSNMRLQENAQIGNGQILYRNAIVATYHWDNDGDDIKGVKLPQLPADVPNITFCATPSVSQAEVDRFERSQYIKRQFLDNYAICSIANWTVQSLRDVLMYDDALALQFIRDKHKGKWEGVSGYRPEMWTLIKQTLQKVAETNFGSFPQHQQTLTDAWLHWAFCAVYEI